jgi:hypothetical protein
MLKTCKKAVSLVLVFALSMMVCVPAFAAEKNGTKIKLDDVYVTTKYDSDSIVIDRNENSKETRVTVKDKATGKVLDVWGEERAKSSDTITSRMAGTFTKRIYHDKTYGPITARLYTTLEMYEYDSFVEIEKVKKMWWAEVSSGNWKLENESTDYHMDHTPGLTVDLYGTATAVVTTTSSTTGSFSISALESIGFSISETTGSTHYARLPIENDYGFSVY